MASSLLKEALLNWCLNIVNSAVVKQASVIYRHMLCVGKAGLLIVLTRRRMEELTAAAGYTLVWYEEVD